LEKIVSVDKLGIVRLPHEVRELLRVIHGGRLRIRTLPTGEVVLVPCISAWQLRGSANPEGIHASLDELKQAIEEEAVARARH